MSDHGKLWRDHPLVEALLLPVRPRIRKLAVDNVLRLLVDLDWKPAGGKAGRYFLFKKNEQITLLPASASLGDYAERMGELVGIVAMVEGITVDALLDRLESLESSF